MPITLRKHQTRHQTSDAPQPQPHHNLATNKNLLQLQINKIILSNKSYRQTTVHRQQLRIENIISYLKKIIFLIKKIYQSF